MNNSDEKDLFENTPVHKAVATLAIPSIICQIVSIIYNLADTFYIGRLANPYMVAAVTLVYPWFNLLTALGNLFGIGAGSLISRLLGSGKKNEVKKVSSFSFYTGIFTTILFSVFSWLFRNPLLRFLGSSSENFNYAQQYLLWVVVLGGPFAMLSMTFAHLLRSEGHAKQASAGMMFGGILNIILDPIFMFAAGMGFVGSAIATALSNFLSVIFFFIVLYRNKKQTSISLSIRAFSVHYTGEIFSVGFASAITAALANISNMVIVKLASAYGDIAVAAYGIVKKNRLISSWYLYGTLPGIYAACRI